MSLEIWDDAAWPQPARRRSNQPVGRAHAFLEQRDRLDRKTLHRLTFPKILLSIPGFAERTRRVPSRAIVEESEIEGQAATLVECPCGSKPIVGAGPDKCPGCERCYVLIGLSVFVIYGDMEIPERSIAAKEG